MSSKKTIYYVVEKELQDIDEFEVTTGWKTITVYKIKKKKFKQWFEIEANKNNNSEKEIQTWLDNNGFEKKEFKMIIL